MQPRVFLSYSWTNKDIADTIDKDWEAVGLTLIRDVRDLAYKQNIKDFMMRVNDSDYVLLLISDGYLKSKNCMYEALEMFQDSEFKKKILPILTDDAKIHNSIDRIEYISHWDNKILELDNKIKTLASLTGTTSIQEELEHFTKIRKTLDEFIKEITSILCSEWPKSKQESYGVIFDHIGFKNSSLLKECRRIISITDEEDQEIELDELSIKYPGNRNVLSTRATVAYQNKKYRKARKLLEVIIASGWESAVTRFNLGLLLDVHFNEPNLAREQYEISVRLDPNDTKSLNNLAALVWKEFGENELARQLFERSLDIDPNDGSIHANLSNILVSYFGEYDLALVHYYKALSISPKDSMVNYNTANLLALYFKEYDLARSYYENAINLNPEFAQAHMNLANILIKHYENYDLAKYHLDKSIEIDPDNKNGYYNLASLLASRASENELAIYYYKKSLEIDPNFAKAHVNFGVLLMELGKKDEAADHYKKGCELDPSVKSNKRDELFGIS